MTTAGMFGDSIKGCHQFLSASSTFHPMESPGKILLHPFPQSYMFWTIGDISQKINTGFGRKHTL